MRRPAPVLIADKKARRMRLHLLATCAIVIGTPTFAQSPQSVPFRENTPSRDTTVGRPASSGDDRTAIQAPNARHVRDGRVAPPAAIDTPVQVIAPERKR
jgi:hypothetical protein